MDILQLVVNEIEEQVRIGPKDEWFSIFEGDPLFAGSPADLNLNPNLLKVLRVLSKLFDEDLIKIYDTQITWPGRIIDSPLTKEELGTSIVSAPLHNILIKPTETFKAYVEQLREQCNGSVSEVKSNLPKEEPLHKKERESLRKMFIGMAASFYKSKRLKNGAIKASDISSDLLEFGIELSDDTIRPHLTESLKYLTDPAE